MELLDSKIVLGPISGKIKSDLENDIIKGCLVTHEKNIIHEMTKNIIEGNA